MNPRYKEKVKEELHCMLDTGIIEPIEESEWIIHIVIKYKKPTGEVRIYVDLRKLNDACQHDPFPVLLEQGPAATQKYAISKQESQRK